MSNCYKVLMLLFLLPLLGHAQFISEDDKLHLAAGALISSGTYTIVYSKTKNKSKAFWYSLGASTLAGLAKEVYDSTKKGNKFDTGEAVATTTGGLIASISFDLFTGKRRKNRN